MNKKIYTILLISVLAISMSACGTKKDSKEIKTTAVPEKATEKNISELIAGTWSGESGIIYRFYDEGKAGVYSSSDKKIYINDYTVATSDGNLKINMGFPNPFSEYTIKIADDKIILTDTDGKKETLTKCKNSQDVDEMDEFLNAAFKDDKDNIYDFSNELTYEGYRTATGEKIEGDYLITSDGNNTILWIQPDFAETGFGYRVEMPGYEVKFTDLQDNSVYMLQYK